MFITAKQEGPNIVYTLRIDVEERKNSDAMLQPGDKEFINTSAKSPLISEKLCALALIAKRIEEGRRVAKALEAAQPIPPKPPVHQNGQ